MINVCQKHVLRIASVQKTTVQKQLPVNWPGHFQDQHGFVLEGTSVGHKRVRQLELNENSNKWVCLY
jgi:hypothetical protein